MTYQLLDSGYLRKLEAFGDIILIRPCPIAIWAPKYPDLWKSARGTFSRENGWQGSVPKEWKCTLGNLELLLEPTEFGHVGVFPDHQMIWKEMDQMIEKDDQVLNLFAYTGVASLVAAKKKGRVVHLDASKPSVEWAKKNASLNGLDKANIRYIVDDAMQFVKREIKRGKSYEGIILDPPSFGRGSKNQVFKIERDLMPLLQGCFKLLSKKAKFLILSCHTPGFTPTVLRQVMSQVAKRESQAAEMFLTSEKGFEVPVGSCTILKMF